MSRIPVLVLGLIVGGAFASCQLEETSVVVEGRVTDRSTGLAIAGALVSDGRYGKAQGTTDSEGNYAYTTAYEEHLIHVAAPGYRSESETLVTKFLGSERTKTINFRLEKE